MESTETSPHGMGTELNFNQILTFKLKLKLKLLNALILLSGFYDNYFLTNVL